MTSTMGGTIATQTWLEPLAEQLGSGVGKLFAAGGETGRRIKDFLNGVWLGHPLHPVITDLPVGAWTAAAAFDLLDWERPDSAYGRAASLCVDAGLVGAVGAAVSGITDWSDTGGGSRRIGLVHGLLNVAAVACYTTSAVVRRRGCAAAGRTYAFAGYGLVCLSAYLGGELVYNRQIGVDHSAEASAPDEFTRVMADGDLLEDTPHKAMVGETAVLLVKHGGRVYAMAEHCAHQGGPLAEGALADGAIECPWHGSRFALDTGEVLRGPSAFRQPCFEARVRDGHVEVRAPRGSV